MSFSFVRKLLWRKKEEKSPLIYITLAEFRFAMSSWPTCGAEDYVFGPE
jgi:hypothetical protein